MSSLNIVNWNVEWCKPSSYKAPILLQRIFRGRPDIVCLTEAHLGFLPDSGYIMTAHSDYGYDSPDESRRKVMLWSKDPWFDIDALGDESLPGGRYIEAKTSTPIGSIICRGICIPWAAAHVRNGRKDRTRWQDHESFIDGLKKLRSKQRVQKELVLGDFNQRFPAKYQPKRLYKKLEDALEGLEVGTRGVVDENGKSAIDHIAHSKCLIATECSILGNTTKEGKQLSDHFGIHMTLKERAIE